MTSASSSIRKRVLRPMKVSHLRRHVVRRRHDDRDYRLRPYRSMEVVHVDVGMVRYTNAILIAAPLKCPARWHRRRRGQRYQDDRRVRCRQVRSSQIPGAGWLWPDAARLCFDRICSRLTADPARAHRRVVRHWIEGAAARHDHGVGDHARNPRLAFGFHRAMDTIGDVA